MSIPPPATAEIEIISTLNESQTVTEMYNPFLFSIPLIKKRDSKKKELYIFVTFGTCLHIKRRLVVECPLKDREVLG